MGYFITVLLFNVPVLLWLYETNTLIFYLSNENYICSMFFFIFLLKQTFVIFINQDDNILEVTL